MATTPNSRGQLYSTSDCPTACHSIFRTCQPTSRITAAAMAKVNTRRTGANPLPRPCAVMLPPDVFDRFAGLFLRVCGALHVDPSTRSGLPPLTDCRAIETPAAPEEP